MNKKGLSTIVTTLIIVALSLVAVGIIWVVVNNLLEDSTQQIDKLTLCNDIRIKVDSSTYNADESTVETKISREGSSEEEIGGILLVYSDDEGNEVGRQDHTENINIFSSETITTTLTDTGQVTPSKVEARFYFINDQGEKSYCDSARVIGEVTTSTE